VLILPTYETSTKPILVMKTVRKKCWLDAELSIPKIKTIAKNECVTVVIHFIGDLFQCNTVLLNDDFLLHFLCCFFL
jgi:hypothetical protein